MMKLGTAAWIGLVLLGVAGGCDRDDTRSPSAPPSAPTPPSPAPQTPAKAVGVIFSS